MNGNKKPIAFRLGRVTLDQLDAIAAYLVSDSTLWFHHRGKAVRTRALEWAIRREFDRLEADKKQRETPSVEAKGKPRRGRKALAK